MIGAGPAGITVAIEMAKKGYPVTIFEWKSKIVSRNSVCQNLYCYMTPRKGVFAAGDVVTGAKTVVHAVENNFTCAAGRKIRSKYL